MATYNRRGVSPPASRRYVDPRASTGTVFASSFDPRQSQYPRSSNETFATARSTADRPYDAQPIKRRTYVDPGQTGATKSRTEYAVRPRQNSAIVDDRRRPLSIVVPSTSPTRSRPVVTNGNRERPRSPPSKARLPRPREDSDRLIYPAVSSPRQHHQRHNSATPADMDHLAVKDRERRERGPYRASGTTAQRAYPTTSALVRYQDEDDYSYTGPREQFDRDYPAQPRPARRDSNTRRERPMSVIDYADSKTLPPAKREPGPPPSATRQLERIGNASGRNSNGRTATGGETERDLDVPRRTHSTRAPVSLHQEREDGYSSQRDDFGDREKHRHHREKSGHDSAYFSDRDRTHHRRHDDRHARPRDASPDPSGAGKGLAVAGLGGIAAAGLAKILPKTTKDPDPDNSDDERKERRTRKRREQDPNDNVFTEDSKARSDRPRDRPQDSRQPRESRRENADRDRVDSDSLEDQPSQRHRRRKHRSKGNNGREEGSGSDLEERPPADHSREDVRWDERFAERVNDDASFGKTEAPVRNPSFAEGFSGPPGDSDDDRPRRVQLVEPLKENQQDQRPKGILKPARQVPFPEDPNPTREGVAPLKEAGKKGVPPGARWTKINRMLVNPAALDAAHERYEEREEYVIVLRVLSREEIEKFAIKTREIRETRDKEWEEEQRQRAGRPRDEVDDGSSDDEHRTPLALGAPTSSPTSIPNKRPTVLPGAGYRHQQDS